MIKAKEYVEAMRPLMAARESRLRRTRPIAVFDHAKFGGPDKTGFGAPGSLNVFVARTAKRLREVQKALDAGRAGMKKLIAQIDNELAGLVQETLKPDDSPGTGTQL